MLNRGTGKAPPREKTRELGEEKKASRNRRSSTSVCAQLAAQHTDGEGTGEGRRRFEARKSLFGRDE